MSINVIKRAAAILILQGLFGAFFGATFLTKEPLVIFVFVLNKPSLSYANLHYPDQKAANLNECQTVNVKM